MESKNDTNAEKSVKKTWFKPEITLLATNNVTSGLNSGHYEKNASAFNGFNAFTLHTPGGNSVNKLGSKNHYIS